MCGFLFGWHVHEKASLHFVIPLAIVAGNSLEDARHYFLLSIGMLNCTLFSKLSK
jgi:alpha-1,3-glucosyltransferase